jgi:hypothetical protein
MATSPQCCKRNREACVPIMFAIGADMRACGAMSGSDPERTSGFCLDFALTLGQVTSLPWGRRPSFRIMVRFS